MKFLNEEGLRRVISWVKSKYIDRVSGTDATLSFYKGEQKQDITINNVDNAKSATNDNLGQAINTTYIKSITASNATLTLTKGNGTTSTYTDIKSTIYNQR